MNKICFFIGGMTRGGAERVISILAEYYAFRGYDVYICLLLDYKVEYPLDKRIKIIDMTQTGKSYATSIPKWVVSIRSFVKRIRPDRIISFVGRVNLLVINACVGLNIPIIVSERNDPNNDGRSKFILKLCELSYRKAYAVVFQTTYQKMCFPKVHDNCVIIPNPVDIATSAQPETKSNACYDIKRSIRIVSAGRLLPQKNQKDLISAFKIISGSITNAQLEIYGEGSLKEDLQRQIDSLGLCEKVKLMGSVLDLHERIKSADVFALSSLYEGLSNALIEALMLGLPCVTTDYPGVKDVIQDNVNGLIVSRNDVNKLAEAIIKILSDQMLQKKLRENALLTSQKYQKSIVIEEWNKLIK